MIEWLALLSLLVASSDDAKCWPTHTLPGQSDDQGVLILDGEISAFYSRLDEVVAQEEMGLLRGACWNPETHEMPADSGVLVVVAVTRPYLERHESSVRELAAKVSDFERRTGAFPATLEELDVADPSRFTYEASEHRWDVSTGRPDQVVDCVGGQVYDGAFRVGCSIAYEHAKAELRQRYDGGTGG